MIYANVEGNKARATPAAKGACPTCGEDVISKCGNVNIWHWAHVSLSDCDTWHEPMTDWHIFWQSKFDDNFVEVTKGNHRADVMLPSGRVIEFQHSPISKEDVEARESFWGDMVWVFDARKAWASERLSSYRFYGRFYFNGKRRWPNRSGIKEITWKWAPKFMYQCRKPVFLHIGYGRTLHLLSAEVDNTPLYGKVTQFNSPSGLIPYLSGPHTIPAHERKTTEMDRLKKAMDYALSSVEPL